MQPFIIKNALSEQTLDFISNLEKNWSKGGFVSDKPEEIYHKQRHSHNVSISSGRRCWTMPLKNNPKISKEIEEIINQISYEYKFNSWNYRLSFIRIQRGGCRFSYRASRCLLSRT